jgi:hypothetical protein
MDWVKRISKTAGVRGVEAKHIVRMMEKQGLDPAVVDWHTLGEETQDFGDRYSTIWKKLSAEYGISKPSTIKGTRRSEGRVNRRLVDGFIGGYSDSLPGLDDMIAFHKQRDPIAVKMDNNIQAKRQVHPSDVKGVRFWFRNPHLCDVIGVDSVSMMNQAIDKPPAPKNAPSRDFFDTPVCRSCGKKITNKASAKHNPFDGSWHCKTCYESGRWMY